MTQPLLLSQWNTSTDLSLDSSDFDNNGTLQGNTSNTWERTETGENIDFDVRIWDIPSIRITFIVLHTIVFILCFLGNLTVILVVTLHWRMRSITNFCLANLAVADLCVAIFCVFQNLYSHMAENWILGKAVCKIYHFINEMSLTASVLILVVISVERYLAIIHPMRCKSWLTLNKLRLTTGGVWGISAVYSLPRLYYTTVINHGLVIGNGEEEYICTSNRQLYNSKLFDEIHMGLLFFFPLFVISILYTRIGITLWKSSKGQIPVPAPSESSTSSNGPHEYRNSLIGRKRRRHSCKDFFCFTSTSTSTSTSNSTSKCFKFSKFGRQSRVELENTNIKNRKTESSTENDFEFRSLKPPIPSPYSSQNEILNGITTNEPIVVVQFEENKTTSFRRRSNSSSSSSCSKKKSQCTLMMSIGSDELSTKKGNNGSKITNEPIENRSISKRKWSKESGWKYSDSSIEFSESKKEVIGTSFISSTTSIPIGLSVGVSTNLRGFKKNETDSTGHLNSPFPHCKETILVEESQEIIQPLPKNEQPKLKRLRVIRRTNYGTKALEARRKIIKMLIVIVLTFTLCNLPFHGRKIWQNWSQSYSGTSTFSLIFTQVTTIIRYANSGINPLLYAFLSVKFRQSLADFLGCRLRRSFRTTRNFSVRSTNIVPVSTAA